jgi:16S rRNA (adenine1518-N6/adenine1519-N6)-dimethyltransferase
LTASRRRRATGQHFLVDRRVVQRIVDASEVDASDTVLEVGPGHGVLTAPLLDMGARVVAVEKDPTLAADLERRLGGNERLRLVDADATRADLGALGPYTRIVSNLPYSVSTPLTFAFLDLPFETAVLMYQREFAQRMAARPGTKAYGRLTASVAFHARVERLFDVAPGAFRPPPDVGSTVVRLVPHAAPPFEVPDVARYRELLRILFSNRRKTLRATLRAQAAALGFASPGQAVDAAESLGWAGRRPETLAPEEFGRLACRMAETSDG